MLPDDAVARIVEGAQSIGKICQSKRIGEWEVVAFQSYGHELDIEAGKITLAAGGGDGGYGVRVLDGGRFGYAHLVDVSGAEHAVSQAISIAKVSPAVEGFCLPENQKSTDVLGRCDNRILDVSPEDLLEQADSILSEVSSLDSRAVVTGGGVGVSATAGAIVTSQGILSSGITTSHGAGVQVSIDENDELTSAWESSSSRKLLKSIPDCIETSVHWAQCTRGPIEVDSQAVDCPVLMTSEGFSPLFSVCIPAAVRGEKLARKESFWSGNEGQMVLANDLTLIDDGLMEGGMGSSSLDGEGVPRQTQTLVENGRLVGSMWSTRDSAQMVAEGRIEYAQSTGSASRGSHQSPPYTGCSDMILKSSKGGNSRDDLISLMDNGYIVHSVMGAHTANPTSGDFSVTTSTILKVVDGQIAGPIKQAGLSGNIAKALSKDVLLGDRPIFQDSYSTGGMHIPDVLVMDGFRINPA